MAKTFEEQLREAFRLTSIDLLPEQEAWELRTRWEATFLRSRSEPLAAWDFDWLRLPARPMGASVGDRAEQDFRALLPVQGIVWCSDGLTDHGAFRVVIEELLAPCIGTDLTFVAEDFSSTLCLAHGAGFGPCFALPEVEPR